MGRSLDRLGSAAAAVMGVYLAACSDAAELPPGWEDAQRVAGLTQSSCGGSALAEQDERATFTAGEKRLGLEYRNAHFRCEQPVEGFYRDSSGRLDVLVQPVDMNPSAVAACDCSYAIDIALDHLGAGPRTVTLFRRWDAHTDPNEPVTISSASVVID